uniref:Fibronectin type-III domain-containing protein n=1 Tax=Anabas testudineus TaxID=64144 RepID=A0A7N6BGY5_ANATE
CPPTGVSSFMNCIANIALVSWSSAAGAMFYTATLTQEDGSSKSCWSDSVQCGLPNVNCGQNYTVTVTASNLHCNSDPTPCVPTDVGVQIDCSTNQALVSWNMSEGALTYTVTAQSTQGPISSCESTDLKCTLTNLTCGQSYSVQVVAQDDICSSLPSPAIKFDSGRKTVITVYLKVSLPCLKGALNYISTARSLSGHVATCNSNNTNCELENLQCGQTYNAIVVASNENCNSPPSNRVTPCPPQNLVPVLDCSTNTVWVEWEASRGADSYIVQAFGEEEPESVCETSSQSCNLPDLICGFTYNISVIALNSVCNVSESDIKQLKTVPCVPQQVEAQVDCQSGAVAVSWEPSAGSLSYTTVAQGNGGYASTCNSTDTTCLFSNLLCSHDYSITVHERTVLIASIILTCLSVVPCVPQKVTAEIVCSNDTGVVSWEKEDGVSSYEVQAFGPDGHKIKCNSTETSCQLPNLHCGQLYNLTVTAQDGRCDSSHAFLDLNCLTSSSSSSSFCLSVPCKVTYVQASLHCQSNSAAVTWEPASGALSYYAVGVTADSIHQSLCNNTMTYCDLNDLQCGQVYNVSVFSQDESCSNVQSDDAYVLTGKVFF